MKTTQNLVLTLIASVLFFSASVIAQEDPVKNKEENQVKTQLQSQDQNQVKTQEQIKSQGDPQTQLKNQNQNQLKTQSKNQVKTQTKEQNKVHGSGFVDADGDGFGDGGSAEVGLGSRSFDLATDVVEARGGVDGHDGVLEEDFIAFLKIALQVARASFGSLDVAHKVQVDGSVVLDSFLVRFNDFG